MKNIFKALLFVFALIVHIYAFADAGEGKVLFAPAQHISQQ